MILIHSSQMNCWKDGTHAQFTDELLDGTHSARNVPYSYRYHR
jgi:hypothetical protein